MRSFTADKSTTRLN